MLLSYINNLSNKLANCIFMVFAASKLRKFSVDKNRGQDIFILSTVFLDRGQGTVDNGTPP